MADAIDHGGWRRIQPDCAVDSKWKALRIGRPTANGS